MKCKNGIKISENHFSFKKKKLTGNFLQEKIEPFYHAGGNIYLVDVIKRALQVTNINRPNLFVPIEKECYSLE